jgi:BirA family biotin operon repressor/biotin-[acetyl-CoA-carboxylase] ligase
MLALARSAEPEGTWLRAGRQTGGKGRQGREWESPPGNLYASTLVRLQPGDPAAPTLALVAGVALHEAVSAFSPAAELTIKWPNDLLARGAKLAGVLLERLDDAVVAGFGVNLAEHPDHTLRPSISVAALGVAAPDPASVLDALAEGFERWLGRWRGEGLAPVRAAWLAAAHPVGTALATHTASGAWIEGLFEGLDESGALRLRLADGTAHVIHAGDVFLI